MRFRTLELVRYGGFANRVIEFGDSAVDLHLVVGPNEAGKSTMLSAIGDFLFGIPAQSSQNWRFAYTELRLRAVLEHNGETLELVRRKGTRATLLKRDDSPAADDALAPWLLGLDRGAFERMFGLDHAKLRAGGSMILEGREEAARIVLEAGTGIAGIGETLKGYGRTATELFKPGGQNPPVNALLRQREEAKADLRDKLLGEADWKAVRDKERRAQSDRDALLGELGTIDKRAAMLSRIQRVRGPLTRLLDVERQLEALGDVPELPGDARAQMVAAEAALGTILVKTGQLRARADKARGDLEAIDVDDVLLGAALDIAALDERRPVVEQAARDLKHRRSDLAQVVQAILEVRTAAKLKGDSFPSPGWTKRATTWRDAMRELNTDLRRQAATRARLDLQAAKLDKPAVGDVVLDPEALQSALSRYPSDAPERRVEAAEAVARAQARVALALNALAPWSGEAAALVDLALPTDALVAEQASAIAFARAQKDGSIADVKTEEQRAIAAQGRIDRQAASGTVPSATIVRDARDARDAVVADVQQRLLGEPQAHDALVGIRLGKTIDDADRLVDRHASEAQRVAEDALATAELGEAVRGRDEAAKREERWTRELERLEGQWADRLRSLGFVEPIPAAGFAAWRGAYAQALTAVDEAAGYARALDRLDERFATALAEIAAEAHRVGAAIAMDLPPAEVVEAARRRLGVLDAALKAREASRLQHEALADAEEQYRLDDVTLATSRATLKQERTVLLAEVEWDGAISPAAIEDALEALAELGGRLTERAGYERQIGGIERDADEFASDVVKLTERLERPLVGSPTDLVRSLADGLQRAQAAAAERTRLVTELEQAEEDAAAVQADGSAHATVIARLRALAGIGADAVQDVSGGLLEERIAAAEGKRALVARQSQILDEVEAISDGLAIEELRREAEEVGVDDAIGELAAIERRREEIGIERETIARSLSEAEGAIGNAGTDDAAADAQQRFQNITSELTQSAEAHVAAATSAALLRWVIDKHRAQSQAPLLARAGTMFSTVTNGAFSRLGIDYGEDDRPRLVGIRVDGSRVDAAGLSEGTRDQLYLALRLAAIETRVGGPVPLICDDLLVTADDGRAGSMFRVLAAAAASTQVIVFTHHAHLIEVARGALGDGAFRLHRIDANVPAQAAA